MKTAHVFALAEGGEYSEGVNLLVYFSSSAYNGYDDDKPEAKLVQNSGELHHHNNSAPNRAFGASMQPSLPRLRKMRPWRLARTSCCPRLVRSALVLVR